MPSPYDTLGVKPTDTFDTIKKAYRNLSRTHHPDKGGDEDAFKSIAQAWEILKDENKRAHYDKTGQAPRKPSDINAAAAEVIADIFDQWLSSVEMEANMHCSDSFDNLINVDVMATIKASIDATLINAENAKGSLTKQLEKLGELSKRCGGGFAAIIESKIAMVNHKLDNEVLPGIEALNLATEMLDDGSWTYLFDEPKELEDSSFHEAYRSAVNAMGDWPTGGFFDED